MVRGLDGTDYLTGAVGLNNLRATDVRERALQSLMRVGPVRDFFLAQRELGVGVRCEARAGRGRVPRRRRSRGGSAS